MEDSQRGRSPSHSTSARHTPVASPSPAYNHLSAVTGPAADFQSSTYATDFNLAATSASQPLFTSSYDFTATSSFYPDCTSGDSAINNQGNATFPDFVTFDATAGLPSSSNFNEPLFNPPADASSYIDNTALDPALLDSQISPQSIPQSNPLGQMATQTQAPTPPHLLAPNMHRQSSSPHGSPRLPQDQFQSPPPFLHSRNQSLDPASAAFPHGQVSEWGGSSAFQGHRRTYSDAHSEISSAHQSPYLPASDSFDHPLEHSPNLAAQDPTMFQDVMGIGHVSLSEAPPSYISPAHSPHISPALLPQNLGPLFQVDNFNLVPSSMTYDPSGMQGVPTHTSGAESFPNMPPSADTPGHADAMSPPQIRFEPAPPSRQASFEPLNKEGADSDALIPPEKPRGRAKSDPFSSRGSNGPSKNLLSPHAAGVGSRSPSPSNKNRRSSTSSLPHRDYILDLADPTRPASTGSPESGGSVRKTQKHPATFQCSLCPKRFTRAYNLRSHLRTHTDERPFVCSHCGKAFARQHDRKRHEGLHSGEKKFVCRGHLKDGNNWGCGRRFARADALGRHFRSEAGRVCIKPLMDEEARERSQPPVEPGAELGIPIMPMPNQQMMVPQQGFAYNIPNQGFQSGMGMSAPQMPIRLPAALLQQYPTLGGIWDTLPSNVPDDLEDVSGRSSFDASSAGEYDDDEQWNGNHGAAFGWASDVGP